MVIKLNNRGISDIEILKDFITSNQKDFEIEILQNDEEWLQIYCEDLTISAAVKNKKKTFYYGDIKKKTLYEVIYSYYSNPHNFSIRKDQQYNRKNKQSTIKSLKIFLGCFLISILLMLIQCVFIVMNSTHYGSLLEKIMHYYFDSNISPRQKSLPIYTIVFFICCIICGIKVLNESKKKKY